MKDYMIYNKNTNTKEIGENLTFEVLPYLIQHE